MANHIRLAALLLALSVLTGCAERETPPAATLPPTANATAATPATRYTAPPFADSVFHPDAAAGENGVLLDLSESSSGIVAVSATAEQKLKFQVRFGDIDYNYDLPNDGTPQCFVLQSGSGAYTFRVMQNTSGSKYAPLYVQEADVTLTDELTPFLRPNQMVSYQKDSACVALAESLAADAASDAEVVAAIYEYIRTHIDYDTNKAKTVQTGYLPDPDVTLATGQGICFDYGALAAAMLRSQGIPTKLITGYVTPGELYHAWNMIWLADSGWITVSLQAPANQWERIDLTFAAGADEAFTGDGTGYTERYTY